MMAQQQTNETFLAEKKCVPCAGGVEPLKGPDLIELISQLDNGWKIVEENHLEKQYKFKNFSQALDFVNKVGELAEKLQHHPDIYLAWGKVKLMLWTHKIKGLHENDFIFAAKADKLYTADG
jgi:4a-hydroxytetrahydrobiopterin dehydratase